MTLLAVHGGWHLKDVLIDVVQQVEQEFYVFGVRAGGRDSDGSRWGSEDAAGHRVRRVTLIWGWSTMTASLKFSQVLGILVKLPQVLQVRV